MPPRLITLTLNPAVDIACTAPLVVHTHKIHTRDDHLDPGGGGINVARVLHELGGDTLAVIMAGGVTGALIEELLDEAGVPRRTIPIKGRTRICFNVFCSTTKLEYRFVQEGPDVTDADWHRMLDVLGTIPGDWLIASGSLEHGMPEDIYARVARAALARGQHFVLDSSGPPLRAALGSGIALMKPSLSELEYLAGRSLPDPAEQEAEAMALVRAGAARLVAVTLGENGALLASKAGVLRLAALRCEVRSAVGAGDSFTAAMALALARGAGLREALTWGVAAGTAAVACSGTARIHRVDVEAQYQRLTEAAATPPAGDLTPDVVPACSCRMNAAPL